MPELEIRTLHYDPYTFDNGIHVPYPKYSYYGSEEPRPEPIDTIIFHSMYVPEDTKLGRTKSYDAQACKDLLEAEGGSSTHYIVDRAGVLYQMVEEERYAWHAGKSKMPEPDNRTGIYTFSLGIELIGDEEEGFTDEQYTTLVGLVVQIMNRHNIENILGHNQISGSPDIRPDIKTDPWNFDWNRFKTMLSQSPDEQKMKQLKLLGPTN